MSDIQNTCCVKQPECVGLPPDHHRHRIIVKNLLKKGNNNQAIFHTRVQFEFIIVV